MAKVAKLPKNRVWPSGAARAAISAATVPPAPSRLSTTTLWPSRSASLPAISRAAMSSTLPGPPGTTQVMVRLGKSCARAGMATAMAAAAANAALRVVAIWARAPVRFIRCGP